MLKFNNIKMLSRLIKIPPYVRPPLDVFTKTGQLSVDRNVNR